MAELIGTTLVDVRDIGGQPKQRYYLPDGTTIYAMPDMHEFAQIVKGKTVASGLRDANLDKGWSLSKPHKLKIHCGGCDGFHNTKKEVSACTEKKEQMRAAYQKKAKQELGLTSDERIDKLESMMEKILQKLGD